LSRFEFAYENPQKGVFKREKEFLSGLQRFSLLSKQAER
jgi:hypothetical protein